MAGSEMPARRPLWVRAVARAGTRRAAAAGQRNLYALLACAALVLVVVESSSDTALAAIARPLGLAAAVLGAVGVAWSWLAVRCVDRNGRWP